MKNFLSIGVLSFAGLLCSCGDDDHALPAYCQDLAELRTNSSGRASLLILDDGCTMNIKNNVSGLVPDTLYRIQALYVKQGSQHVSLEGAKMIVSPKPIEYGEVELHTDPIVLKALWNCKRYINLLVDVKTGGGRQTFGFIDKGITHTHDGKQKLLLLLYHDQEEDPTYYTQETYMSCPIYEYSHELTAGTDSVEIEINTFEGILRKSFLY